MEESYFRKLLDPKGVKLEFLLEFLSDIIYGDIGKEVILAKVIKGYNNNQNFGVGNNELGIEVGETVRLLCDPKVLKKDKEVDESGKNEFVFTGEKRNKSVGSFPAECVRVLNPKEWTCKDVVDFVVKPLTDRDHSIFSKTWKIKQQIKEVKVEKHKKLKHFVVNQELDKFYDVVQGVATHFKGKNFSKEYVWLDVVCLNHHVFEKLILTAKLHRPSSMLFKFVASKLKNLIGLFDGTLVFFDKFDKPSCLGDSFSLWKIYLTLKVEKKVEAVFTRKEKKRTLRQLGSEYSSVVNSLPKIRVQNIISPVAASMADFKIHKIIETMLLGNKNIVAEMNEIIPNKFLKLYFGQLSVAMWHERKQDLVLQRNKLDPKHFNDSEKEYSAKGDYHKDNDLLEMAHLSNKIGIQVYNDLNWTDLAKVVFFFSAKSYMKALGKHHSFVASAMQNLALVSYELGSYEKAISYIKQSIENGKRHKGGENVNLADNLNILANLLRDVNKNNAAEKIYHEMLVEYQREFEHDDSLFMAVGFNNLAEFLKSVDRLEEAEIIYKESLRILRICSRVPDGFKATTTIKKEVIARLAKESLHLMVLVYNNLGVLYEEMKKVDLALESYNKSLVLLRKLRNEDDMLLDQCLNNVATFLFVNKRFSEAEELIRNSIKIRVTNYGKQHNVVAQGLENLAILLRNMNSRKKQQNAIKPLIRACEIFNETLGDKHPRTIKCQEMIKACIQ